MRGSFFSVNILFTSECPRTRAIKGSTFSENVNTPSKSVHCSHFCTYFRAVILPKNVNKTSSNELKLALDQHGTSTKTIFL